MPSRVSDFATPGPPIGGARPSAGPVLERRNAMRYRPDIDGLRAVAVLPVLFFHAGVPGFAGGFVGVDIFFVISGYVITARWKEDIVRSRFSILDFYERRVRRIFPALLFVFALTWAASLILLLPSEMVD